MLDQEVDVVLSVDEGALFVRGVVGELGKDEGGERGCGGAGGGGVFG
jgi:hypothetical protein